MKPLLNLGVCSLCAVALCAQSKPALSDQIGVMLQLENMLPANGQFGSRAGEVDQQFQLLQDAGVKWTRDSIGWEQIELQRGVLNWTAADIVVASARNHKVNIVWTVGNTALWDSTDSDWNGVPLDLANPNGAFPQFVAKLVARYKSDIHYWEIHNEPNLGYSWVNTSAADYATYLAQAYKAIKSADSSATVVFGGLGGSPSQQMTWFQKVVTALRAANVSPLPFDILNFHFYGGDADTNGFTGKDGVAKYLASCETKIQQAFTDNNLSPIPVWITEFDYPAAIPQQSNDPDLHNGSSSQVLFASTLLPKFSLMHPDRKVFWAALLDDYDSGFTSMGLVQSNAQHQTLTPRAAYATVKDLLTNGFSTAVVSAASFTPGATLAPEAIVAAFAAGSPLAVLATSTAAAGTPLPATLAGTSVSVNDSAGISREAPLFFAAPGQVNLLIPVGTAAGAASLTITNSKGATATSVIQVAAVAPALFSQNSNGSGVAAANVVRTSGGNNTIEPAAQLAANGQWVTLPIDLGPPTDQVRLVLYGTGIHNNTDLTQVSVKIGSTSVAVEYAGKQGAFVGLDQVNVLLPRSLQGSGDQDVLLTVAGQAANAVKINVR